MKSKFKLFHYIYTHFLKLKLVDRCLVIFMAILFVQLTFTLFGHEQQSADMQGTVSQLRDFVSGCIGFLVGSPCDEDKQGKG